MRRVESPEERRSRSPRRCGRPAPRSATPACSSSRPSCDRGTSRCRSSQTRPVTPCTCSSATARCSGVTRRSSRSRPRWNISAELREALHRDAVAFAKSIGYVSAGTVEFLVDTAGERAGEHVFIEMNPRIQVEHTVTEEVTDVDLVQSQIRIAAGETLDDLGLDQGQHRLRGAALQCRITTEDPSQDFFRPDTGRITTYRSPGRRRHPARRWHHRGGSGDQPALRLDAHEDDVPRTRLPGRRRACEARPRAVSRIPAS